MIFCCFFSIWFVKKYFEVQLYSIYTLDDNIFTWDEFNNASAFKRSLYWGEFNNASALGRSLYWCPALHIMNKDRYQSTSARRALALLNSPPVSGFTHYELR